jgi:hypothetical protein
MNTVFNTAATRAFHPPKESTSSVSLRAILLSLANPVIFVNFLVIAGIEGFRPKGTVSPQVTAEDPEDSYAGFDRGPSAVEKGYNFLFGNIGHLTAWSWNFAVSQFALKTRVGVVKGMFGLLGALLTVGLAWGSLLGSVGVMPIASGILTGAAYVVKHLPYASMGTLAMITHRAVIGAANVIISLFAGLARGVKGPAVEKSGENPGSPSRSDSAAPAPAPAHPEGAAVRGGPDGPANVQQESRSSTPFSDSHSRSDSRSRSDSDSADEEGADPGLGGGNPLA